MGSSDGVQGYDKDQIALVILDFCGTGPNHFGNSHDKLHHKCDKGEGDRCPGNALGDC